MSGTLLKFVLLLPIFGFGQGILVVAAQTALRSVNGGITPSPNADITVCSANAGAMACTPSNVALHSNPAINEPLPTPFNADSSENYSFTVLPRTNRTAVPGTGYSGYSYQATVPPSFSTNLALTDYNFGTGAWTYSVNLCRFQSLRYVDPRNTCGWSGTDANAWLVSAYADCPSTGCMIFVVPKDDGSCYVSKTLVTFTTNLKGIVIQGSGAQNTCIDTQISSGTAYTFDTGAGHFPASGFRDIWLKDSVAGNTATGVVMGPTNGDDQFRAMNSRVSGFKTLIQKTQALAFNVTFDNVTMGPCSSATGSTAYSWNATGDNDRIINSALFQCNNLLVAGSGASNELNLVNVSLEDANGSFPTWINISAASTVSCVDCHFENLGKAVPLWETESIGQFYCIRCEFVDDRVEGSLTSYITVTNGTIGLTNSKIFSNGETATEFVLFAGTSFGSFIGNILPSSLQIPFIWNTSYAGWVSEIGTARGDHNPVPNWMRNQQLNLTQLVFDSDVPNPSNTTPTCYNQSGVGPTCSGNAFQIRTGATPTDFFDIDSSGNAMFKGPMLSLPSSTRATNLLISSTAPTISSGFGTSPSIQFQNGTAAFTINVGTGGTAANGVIGLPSATNGWYCSCNDLTTKAAAQASCQQTATTTTMATIANFNMSMVQTAWAASDKISVSCYAY